MRTRELSLWCLLAAALIIGHLGVSHGPVLNDDSYQYLSVAAQFRQGRVAHTSIVHFDTERSFGRVPAPLTTFPAGYPLIISTFTVSGLGPEQSGMLISAIAAVALLVFYQIAGAMLRLGGFARRMLFLSTVGNSQVGYYATAVMAESLFTALGLAAILLLVAALERPLPARRQWVLIVSAHVVVGLSYWVRYAGLFLFTTAAVHAVFQLMARRDRRSIRAASGLLVSATIVAAGLIRNQLLVGTWKGGNELPASHSPREVAVGYVTSIHHLFLGEMVPIRRGTAELLFLLGVAVALIFSLRWLARRRATVFRGSRLPGLLLCYAGIYSAAMVYMGLHSVISFGTRMFYPLLPIFLLIAAHVISQAHGGEHGSPRALFAGSVALATAACLVINLRSYAAAPPRPWCEIARERLAEEVAPGLSLQSWIEAHVGADETIVANQGQATGHVLHRKTVSLVPHAFSRSSWDERDLAEVMGRFGARYLILQLDDRADMPLTLESPFLSGLVRKRSVPWLALEVQTRHVVLFRRTR